MALKIKFQDGSEVNYLSAVDMDEFWNGSSRRTLTFELARDAANLEALDGLCAENNIKHLELINEDDGVTNIYDGYALKLKVGVEPVQVAADSPSAPAVYEERIILKLGQRTYIEQLLHDMGIGA